MILGLPWLKEYNPKIDWKKGTVNIDPNQRRMTLGKAMRKTMELSQMMIVEPIPRLTIEEIFEDTDHLPRNTPLTEEEPILINLLEEEEIGILRTYSDQQNRCNVGDSQLDWQIL